MEIPYIPPEILTAIFLRLPIESLYNVILVNKFCFQLITSSDFARAHLELGQTNLSSYGLIFSTLSDCRLLRQFSFASLWFNSSSFNVLNLNYLKNALHKSDVRLVGSCGGLVCIVMEETRVFLWNPCTGEHKELPRLRVNYIEGLYQIAYGFGCDESSGDYKVVALVNQSFAPNKRHWSMVFVWSLKRNSWKRNPNLRRCLNRETGKFVGGRVHWSMWDNENSRRDILSFDLARGVFGIVERPSNFGDSSFQMIIDELEGRICLLLYDTQQKNESLWVMKEYGVKDSWTKVFTISKPYILNGFTPSFMLPNNKILFHSSKSLAVYNPKNDSFMVFRGGSAREYTKYNFFQPIVYVQSLVSPLV